MVTRGSAFPAEGSLVPRCTFGLLSRWSSLRLLQGTFLEVSAELAAGLETQHTTQELPQPGTFLCRKQSFGRYLLFAVTGAFVPIAQPVGCFSQQHVRGTSSAVW